MFWSCIYFGDVYIMEMYISKGRLLYHFRSEPQPSLFSLPFARVHQCDFVNYIQAAHANKLFIATCSQGVVLY